MVISVETSKAHAIRRERALGLAPSTRPLRVAEGDESHERSESYFNAKAISSAFSPEPVAITTYCWPTAPGESFVR